MPATNSVTASFTSLNSFRKLSMMVTPAPSTVAALWRSAIRFRIIVTSSTRPNMVQNFKSPSLHLVVFEPPKFLPKLAHARRTHRRHCDKILLFAFPKFGNMSSAIFFLFCRALIIRRSAATTLWECTTYTFGPVSFSPLSPLRVAWDWQTPPKSQQLDHTEYPSLSLTFTALNPTWKSALKLSWF